MRDPGASNSRDAVGQFTCTKEPHTFLSGHPAEPEHFDRHSSPTDISPRIHCWAPDFPEDPSQTVPPDLNAPGIRERDGCTLTDPDPTSRGEPETPGNINHLRTIGRPNFYALSSSRPLPTLVIPCFRGGGPAGSFFYDSFRPVMRRLFRRLVARKPGDPGAVLEVNWSSRSVLAGP